MLQCTVRAWTAAKGALLWPSFITFRLRAACACCSSRCTHPQPNAIAEDLYAPAAPRHDDAFHRSIGGAMASLGRHLSAGGLGAEPDAPAAMDIEEGYWQALRPDLKGQTQVGSVVHMGAGRV